jgi:alpha-L-fucosidase
MKVNHEAIYATSASPFKRLPWGRCTTKVEHGGATLYLHVFNWPTDGKLLVPGLKNPVEKAYLLADPKQLISSVNNPDGMTLTVPTGCPDPISSTVVLQVKGKLDIVQPGIFQDYDGSVALPASEARLHGSDIKYETGAQRDNIGFWFSPNDWADWEVNVTKAGKFEVTAEVAATDAASLEVSAGGSKSTGQAASTGDYGKFKVTKLGTVEISSPGKINIGLHAVPTGWHPLNVKALRLKPAGNSQ